jgi:hypothetical protein
MRYQRIVCIDHADFLSCSVGYFESYGCSKSRFPNNSQVTITTTHASMIHRQRTHFREQSRAGGRVTDSVFISRPHAEHVVLLATIVLHYEAGLFDVARYFQPVFARRTTPFDDIVDISDDCIIRQFSRQPRQSATQRSKDKNERNGTCRC